MTTRDVVQILEAVFRQKSQNLAKFVEVALASFMVQVAQGGELVVDGADPGARH